MVLLSFLLVLAAAVTLVIGLVGTGLGLIYVSIACSLAAGIVLAVAVVRSRPSTELAAAGPAPLASSEPHTFSPTPSTPRASVGGGVTILDREEPTTRGDDTLDVGERIRVFAEPERRVEAAEEPEVEPVAEVDVEPAGEDVFAPAAQVEPEPEPVTAGATWDVRDDDWTRADEDVFPIADYDSLRVSQIVPLLGELDPDELEVVREREVEVKGGRASVLNRIDQLLGRAPVPAAAKAPAKKAPAKKAPAKKAAAKKAAAKKAPAAPAKKAPAKKAAAPAATKAAAKKAPAEPPKKAAAKKAAPAKKAAKAAKKA